MFYHRVKALLSQGYQELVFKIIVISDFVLNNCPHLSVEVVINQEILTKNCHLNCDATCSVYRCVSVHNLVVCVCVSMCVRAHGRVCV